MRKGMNCSILRYRWTCIWAAPRSERLPSGDERGRPSPTFPWSISERLQLSQRLGDDHIAGSRAGIQGDVRRAGRKTQAVDGFHEVAVDVVHLNTASRGRNTGKLLPDEKQLVDRVEGDITAALGLVGCALQGDDKAGLLGQIVKFQAEINFRCRHGDAVCRIHRDAVDKSKSQSLKLAHGFRNKIHFRNLRDVEYAAGRRGHHRLVGLGINADHRRIAQAENGVGQLNQGTESVACDVRAEDHGGEALGRENRGGARTLAGGESENQFRLGERWHPPSGKLIGAERVQGGIDSLVHEKAFDFLQLHQADAVSEDSQGNKVVLGLLLLGDDLQNLAGSLIEGLNRDIEIPVGEGERLAQHSFRSVLIDVITQNESSEGGLDEHRARRRLRAPGFSAEGNKTEEKGQGWERQDDERALRVFQGNSSWLVWERPFGSRPPTNRHSLIEQSLLGL